MDTRDEPATDEAESAREPRWVRRTPILPVQWWGPPAAGAAGALAVLAVGIWLHRSALPVAIIVSAVGLVGAVVLAVLGRRAYWWPSRSASWLLHRARVIVWNAAAVALAVFALAIGARAILFGIAFAAFGVRRGRRTEPTRFELRGRTVASVAVAVASAALGLVGLAVPGIDEWYSARWIGWCIVVVPLSVVAAVLTWRASIRAPGPGEESESDEPLSAPDRTAS